MNTKHRPDDSMVYSCYLQIEQDVESCPHFLSRSLCQSMKGIISLITTGEKETKVSRP